jgi:hypothetical protein
MPNLEDGGSFKAEDGELSCMMINLLDMYEWDPNFIQVVALADGERVGYHPGMSGAEGKKYKRIPQKGRIQGNIQGSLQRTFRGARGIYC